MLHRIFLLSLGILISSHGLHAASSAATEKEYQQVRTIALRDARVQSAYRDADRRLDAKILQIDPALESYVKARQSAREGTPAPKLTAKPFVAAKPSAKPATKSTPAKAAPKPAPAKSVAANKTTHVVASGETLGGIAAKHRVSVAALKSANHISDDRKLRVGQVLTLPSAKGTPAPKAEQGVWSRLMH